MKQTFTVVIETKKAHQPTQEDISRVIIELVKKRIKAFNSPSANFSVHITPRREI
jgi:predicted oxidoreductase (fatty acid repression mutant protein)